MGTSFTIHQAAFSQSRLRNIPGSTYMILKPCFQVFITTPISQEEPLPCHHHSLMEEWNMKMELLPPSPSRRRMLWNFLIGAPNPKQINVRKMLPNSWPSSVSLF